MTRPQSSERSKQFIGGEKNEDGQAYWRRVPFVKRCATPRSATSPNQTEPSGANAMELGALRGFGRLKVVTAPNCGEGESCTFETPAGWEHTPGEPALP